MNTLRKYSKYVWFMFTRVNAQIINVSIRREYGLGYMPTDIIKRIFNDLGMETDRNYVSISPEAAESLVGLLTTLGIKFRQTTGN